MDRAVLVGQGRTLNVVAALGQNAPASPAPTATGRSDEETRPRSIEPLDTAIRDHIERALRATHGRVEGPHGAARLLRVNPHTLRARMRKLRIPWKAFRPSRNDTG